MSKIESFFSIRNYTLCYFAINYIHNEDESSYFIVSRDINSALDGFFQNKEKEGISLLHENILFINEIAVLHPN